MLKFDFHKKTSKTRSRPEKGHFPGFCPVSVWHSYGVRMGVCPYRGGIRMGGEFGTYQGACPVQTEVGTRYGSNFISRSVPFSANEPCKGFKTGHFPAHRFRELFPAPKGVEPDPSLPVLLRKPHFPTVPIFGKFALKEIGVHDKDSIHRPR